MNLTGIWSCLPNVKMDLDSCYHINPGIHLQDSTKSEQVTECLFHRVFSRPPGVNNKGDIESDDQWPAPMFQWSLQSTMRDSMLMISKTGGLENTLWNGLSAPDAGGFAQVRNPPAHPGRISYSCHHTCGKITFLNHTRSPKCQRIRRIQTLAQQANWKRIGMWIQWSDWHSLPS